MRSNDLLGGHCAQICNFGCHMSMLPYGAVGASLRPTLACYTTTNHRRGDFATPPTTGWQRPATSKPDHPPPSKKSDPTPRAATACPSPIFYTGPKGWAFFL
jgi:hypothetical protein